MLATYALPYFAESSYHERREKVGHSPIDLCAPARSGYGCLVSTARGRSAVLGALRRASAQPHDGEVLGSDRVSGSSEGNLAYMHEIERSRVKVGGAAEPRLSSLRVTTVFRREEGGWRILHRHADPITTPRPIESTLED